MRKVVILYEEINEAILSENILLLKELWEDSGYEVREMIVRIEQSPDIYMNELVQLNEGFLITFAMAGFAWRGLMEQVRFNMLAVKQIHILVGNSPLYDYYLQKEYGIHCFFFTDNYEIFDNWEKKYPQVPFLNYIPTLYIAEQLTDIEKESNGKTLHMVIQKVMDFIKEPVVL